MNILFLQSASYDGAIAGGIVAFIMGLLALFLVLFVALWIYTSFAYMAIAKKNKQSSPGLAWIPYFGPAIVAYNASKMHWWPWLLLIGFILPAIGSIASLVFFIYIIIWNWKMLEAIKKPGWWAVFMIIMPVYLVMLGIAAWSKD